MVLEIGKKYISKGLRIIPIPYREKAPNIKGWQDLVVTEGNVNLYFSNPRQNIGVLLGCKAGGIADVDLDSAAAISLARYFLPRTDSIFGRKGKASSHWEYKIDRDVYQRYLDPVQKRFDEKGSPKNVCHVELRAKAGLQTIYPGSTHPSGELIEWVRDGEPSRVSAKELSRAVSKLAAACLLVSSWVPGIRNDLALALCGTLFRHGFPRAEVDTFLRAVCNAAGDTEDRSGAVQHTFERFISGKEIVGIPRLASLINREIVRKFCEWLKISDGPDESSKVSNKGPAPTPIRLKRMSEVEAREVEWVWRPFVPKGFFTLADGPEGVGKTFTLLKIAATVASGGTLPETDLPAPSGNVLLLSAEDSASFILKPRLLSIGAPCERIYVLDEPFTLNENGFERLAVSLDQHQFKLVLIDPLFSFTGKVNINSDSEIRTITDRINRMAEKYETAIVGIRHLGKANGGGDVRRAGLNGVAWRASARSHLIIGHHPEDKDNRAIVQTKNNLAPESQFAIGYKITRDGGFEWTGRSDLTADLMLSLREVRSAEQLQRRAEAIRFLREHLGSGPQGAKMLKSVAREAGISSRTLERAKTDLKVRSLKSPGFVSGWSWELPGEQCQDSREGCQTRQDGDLGHNVVGKPFSSGPPAEERQSPIVGIIRGFVAGRPYGKCRVCQKDVYLDAHCPYCRPDGSGYGH